MPHRGIRFAYAAFLVFSCVAAFVVLRGDEQAGVQGNDATVRVAGDGRASGRQVVAMVEAFAHRRGVNVGKEQPDLTDPGNVRHLYLAVGDPDAPTTSWPSAGYPAFVPGITTRIHDIGEAASSHPGGYYMVFGDGEAAQELAAEFTKLGFEAEAHRPTLTGWIAAYLSDGSLLWCLPIVTTVTMSLVALSVIMDAKAYGIQRLQGRSFAAILARDLRLLLRFLAWLVPLLLAVLVAALYAYNGLNQVADFLMTAAGFAAVWTVVALATHVVALTFRTRIVSAIKGEVSGLLAMLCTYAVRLAAVLLAFTVAVSVLAAWKTLENHKASRQQWVAAGHAVRVYLSGTATSREGVPVMEQAVGRWVRDADRHGDAIIAVRRFLTEMTTVHGELLVVNDTYLRHQRVMLASGKPARAARRDVEVLIPPMPAHRQAEVVAGVTRWAALMADLAETPVPKVVPRGLAEGQTLFAYGSGQGYVRDHLLSDSVVVVLPREADLIPPAEYTAYATMGGVVFPDPAVVAKARADAAMAVYINGVQPVARKAADEHRRLEWEFRFQLLNLAAALAVLFVTGVGIGIGFCRKNAKRIFVQHVHGWSFLATYRKVLTIEGAVIAAFLAWITWDTLSSLARLRGRIPGSMPPWEYDELAAVTGWEPVLVAGIGSAGLGFIVATLVSLNRRFVKEVSADA
ncbi:hypothetical protein [Thermoactinospora rubra]|uniref:hypothetical protein n=1 Tax=Thermoactinospora rubra TaxID=1088767 RepID=UPI001F0B2015|nr:hypothetical protein [Thermoactinospora rubra]